MVITPWKYKESVFFLHIQTRTYCGHVFQENFHNKRIVWLGVPAEIAPTTYFLMQIKPKIILILIELRQK